MDEPYDGDFGANPIHKQFVDSRHEDANGGQGGIRLEVVVTGLGLGAALAPARKGADFDRGFGVNGDSLIPLAPRQRRHCSYSPAQRWRRSRGSFFWFALGNLLWVVAQAIEFARDGLHRRQFSSRFAGRFIAVALEDQLAPRFGGVKPGVQPLAAKLRVDLTLRVDNGRYIRE